MIQVVITAWPKEDKGLASTGRWKSMKTMLAFSQVNSKHLTRLVHS